MDIKSLGGKTEKATIKEIIFVKQHFISSTCILQEKDPLDSCFHHFGYCFHKFCQSADVAFAFRLKPSIKIFLKCT